jgi:hypothetical protein
VAKSPAVPETGELTEVVLTEKELNSLFGINDDNVMWDLNSVEDLDEYFADQGGIIEFKGSPFTLIRKDEKGMLENQPFTVVDTRWYESKQFGNMVVAVMLITDDPIKGENKFLFNDGSTGVRQQMEAMVTHTKRRGGFRCPRGLRASHYTVWDKVDLDGAPMKDAKEIEATTYYIQ